MTRFCCAGAEPVTLPDCTVPDSKLNKRYCLPAKEQQTAPLIHQIVSFKRWLTNPVQLDRDFAYVGSRTITNIMKDIHLYLGYLFHFESAKAPHLEAFLSMDLYAKYVSFQIKKGNSFISLEHQISHAKRVLQFLSRTADASFQQQVSEIQSWLVRLKTQLAALLRRPRTDVVELQAQGAWLDAKTIVTVLERFRLEALEALPAFGQYTPFVARLLHDACLTNTMFGYLPPVRVSCLRKLQLPSTTLGCLDKDCRIPGCRGNRLEYKADGLYMNLPHHKNQKRCDLCSTLFAYFLYMDDRCCETCVS